MVEEASNFVKISPSTSLISRTLRHRKHSKIKLFMNLVLRENN